MPTKDQLNRFVSIVREIDGVGTLWQRYVPKEVIALLRLTEKYIIKQDPENGASDFYDISKT